MILIDVLKDFLVSIFADKAKETYQEEKERTGKHYDPEPPIRPDHLNPVKDRAMNGRRNFFREWKATPFKPKFFLLSGLLVFAAGAALMMSPEFAATAPWLTNLVEAMRSTNLTYPALFGAGMLNHVGVSAFRGIYDADMKTTRRRRREAARLRRLAEKKGPLEKARAKEPNIENDLILIRNGEMKALNLNVIEKHIDIPAEVTRIGDAVYAYNTSDAAQAGKTLVIPQTCREVEFDKAPGNITWGFDSAEAKEKFCMNFEFRTDGTGGGTYVYNGRNIRIEGDTFLSHLAAVEALNPAKEKKEDWWSSDADPRLMRMNFVKEARDALINVRRLDYEDRRAVADEAWKYTRSGQLGIGEFLAILSATNIPKTEYRRQRGVITVGPEEEAEYRAWHMIRWKSPDGKRPAYNVLKGPALVSSLVEKRIELIAERNSRARIERENAIALAMEAKINRYADSFALLGKRKVRGALSDLERKEGREVRVAVEKAMEERRALDADERMWRDIVSGRGGR